MNEKTKRLVLKAFPGPVWADLRKTIYGAKSLEELRTMTHYMLGGLGRARLACLITNFPPDWNA